MGLRSNLNLSEPIVIHWLDARCFAVTEPHRESCRACGKGRPRSPPTGRERREAALRRLLRYRTMLPRPAFAAGGRAAHPKFPVERLLALDVGLLFLGLLHLGGLGLLGSLGLGLLGLLLPLLLLGGLLRGFGLL